MSTQLRLRFHNVTLIENDHQLIVQTSHGNFTIANITDGLRAAFQLLQEGCPLDNLTAQVSGKHFSETLRLQSYLRQFGRFICHELYDGDQKITVSTPISAFYQPSSFDAQAEYTLSRFAYLRRDESGFILQSPTAYAQVWLRDAALLDHIHEYPLFRELLARAGMLTAAGEEWRSLNQWAFHDLLFQTKTRERFSREPHPSQASSIPAIKPPMSETVVPLHTPDMEQLKDVDIPFTQVLENRKTIRHYRSMLTAEQLGEFLYRCARIKEVVTGNTYNTTRRVYPSAGASYTLEIYPVVRQCHGIEQGFYHYCPQRHVLEKLTVNESFVDELLKEVSLYTGHQVETPQVFLIITARFKRILWKYDMTALSLILKDVGGLFQTMYLVATAMQLAPCAIGAGSSDFFTQATGIDYYTETSVGEFLLGG